VLITWLLFPMPIWNARPGCRRRAPVGPAGNSADDVRRTSAGPHREAQIGQRLVGLCCAEESSGEVDEALPSSVSETRFPRGRGVAQMPPLRRFTAVWPPAA
jgi:hypothetical protein